jgi:hypothetical protein
MEYYFYSNNDPNCEPIYSCKAEDVFIAIGYFKILKALNTEDFLKLYSIGIKE